MKKYIILSAGRSGDFGSTTLINEDVWNFLNNKEIDSLSEETLNEIKSFLNNPTEEELIDELEGDKILSTITFNQINNLAQKQPNF